MINRYTILLTLTCALLLSACSDSTFPSATGKGTVRAINAIETSPDLRFLIEERLISTVPYKGVSSFAEYDDLEYNFNIEAFFSGNTVNTRIATRHLDVVANQDYTFLISGSIAAPVITLWETSVSAPDANATVFRARFAHTSSSLAAVDYYFAAEGIAPILGEQVATLSFGEITDPVDLAAGAYVITITPAGDPTVTLYSSSATVFAEQSDFIIAAFDGDADDNAPIVVRAINSLGTAISMIDPSFAATVEFLHGSLDLGASDIYDDEALLSRLVDGHDHKEVSAEIPIASGDQTFRYTPAGSTAAVTFEYATSFAPGIRYRITALGAAGSFVGTTNIPDRRPIDTAVKLLAFQTSKNFQFLAFYAVAPGESVDGATPFRAGLGPGQANPASGVAAGSYDLYVTESGESVVLAGPVRVDVELGDVLDLVAYDTADPAILDLQIISGP